MENNIAGQANTFPKHNCLDWHTKVYGGSQLGSMTTCGICGQITDFLHRSYWQRIKNVFRGKLSK